MLKIPKILEATTFSFCISGQKLFRTIWTRPPTTLLERSSAPSTQQAANYHELRGQKYNKNHQRVLTHIFEGITTLSLELLST